MNRTPTLPLDDPPGAWDTEWAGDLMSKALRYLNERYVEEADLSVLGEWHDEIVAAGVAEDRERYRKAVRGYVRAGLQAFDQARQPRGKVAANEQSSAVGSLFTYSLTSITKASEG